MSQQVMTLGGKNRLDYKMLLGDWVNILHHSLLDTSYMDSLVDFLERAYGNQKIHPRQGDVFRAFRMTQFKDVKVVIVGQDPYPDGRATGLAFANEDQKALLGYPSPSLEKVKGCIEKTIYKNFNLDFDPTLSHWANQGVLLLNSALTVEEGKMGGHCKYWSKFMEAVLSAISDNKTGVHYLFLGGQATMLRNNVNHKSNNVFSYVHPAYSARKGEDWNCPFFKKINDLITEQNGEEHCIKW